MRKQDFQECLDRNRDIIRSRLSGRELSLVQCFIAGRSWAKIARDHNCSVGRVRTIAKKVVRTLEG